MTIAILLAALLALAGWMAYSRRGERGRPAPAPPGSGLAAAGPPVDTERVRAASEAAARRLWKIAFGVPSPQPPLVRAHARVRDLICAVLQVDTLDPAYFPRRPALMPQLLQAMDDPTAESDKLARMIAHDPVLSADVLRMANSSLYRASAAPVETIKRAIVVCGVDALRGIIAAAMLQPVFRASKSNFPRLPRLLWERMERAARAAELYAVQRHPQDRFEAHLVVLLSALGPLAVYGAALDGYSRAPQLTPNPSLCAELVATLGAQMSQRIAKDWEASPRLVSALASGEESLAAALHVGELLGTLSLLEAQAVISRDERRAIVRGAGLSDELSEDIWARISGGARVTAN